MTQDILSWFKDFQTIFFLFGVESLINETDASRGQSKQLGAVPTNLLSTIPTPPRWPLSHFQGTLGLYTHPSKISDVIHYRFILPMAYYLFSLRKLWITWKTKSLFVGSGSCNLFSLSLLLTFPPWLPVETGVIWGQVCLKALYL